MTEDEMVGWHHQLYGHEFEQALGVGDGQGGLPAAVHGVTSVRHNLMTKPPPRFIPNVEAETPILWPPDAKS